MLCSVNPVGKLIIDIQSVQLRCHLIVNRRPRIASIETDIGTTIVSLDHSLVVFRVNPQVVVIPMRRCNFLKTAAAIG